MHKDQLKQSSLIKIFPLPLDTISTHPSLHSSTAVSSSLAQTITAQQAFLLTSLFLECSSSTSGPSPPAFLNYKNTKTLLLTQLIYSIPARTAYQILHPKHSSLVGKQGWAGRKTFIGILCSCEPCAGWSWRELRSGSRPTSLLALACFSVIRLRCRNWKAHATQDCHGELSSSFLHSAAS